MNEKKQIEELAEYIFGNAITHDTRFKEDCRSIAIDLYTEGYRKQEWISVDERLPENIVNCIVHYVHSYSCEDGYYAIGMFLYDGNKFIIGKEYKVTHWMPLPEAPKMKGGAE